MTKNDVVDFVSEHRKKIIFGAAALAGGAFLIGGGKTVKRSMKAVQNNAKDMDWAMDFGVLVIVAIIIIIPIVFCLRAMAKHDREVDELYKRKF